jgi:DNA-directed RNA polymerase specialized sigma24 family protein
MMGGAVKLDPPMKMVHPEALSAGIRLARELDRLDHLFSDAPEYRELRARATAFLDAMNALLAADPTPDALRVLQQQPPSGGHHALVLPAGKPGERARLKHLLPPDESPDTEAIERTSGTISDLDESLIRAMAESDLGETEAQVLAMSELGGMDAVAIAKELGSSRAAVDTALSRARKKIKQSMFCLSDSLRRELGDRGRALHPRHGVGRG